MNDELTCNTSAAPTATNKNNKNGLYIQMTVKTELSGSQLIHPKLHIEETRCQSNKKYTPRPTQSCGTNSSVMPDFPCNSVDLTSITRSFAVSKISINDITVICRLFRCTSSSSTSISPWCWASSGGTLLAVE